MSAARSNFDGLGAVDLDQRPSNAALFEGLHPVVAVRENSRTKNAGAAARRRAAGENVESAAHLCASLSVAPAIASRSPSRTAPDGACRRPRQCRAESGAGGAQAKVAAPAPPPKPRGLLPECSQSSALGNQKKDELLSDTDHRLLTLYAVPAFLPTARQTNSLLLIGLLALGEALYLRYLAIEYAPVSLACQGGLKTWLCALQAGHRPL